MKSFHDENENPLIGIFGAPFEPHEVVVLQQDSTEAFRQTIDDGGKITFALFDGIGEIDFTPSTKDFYIHFNKENEKTEVDTLTVKYLFQQTASCPQVQYKEFEVYHNGTLVREDNFDSKIKLYKTN